MAAAPAGGSRRRVVRHGPPRAADGRHALGTRQHAGARDGGQLAGGCALRMGGEDGGGGDVAAGVLEHVGAKVGEEEEEVDVLAERW